MALYIAAGTRRRRTIMFTAAAAIVGLLVGLGVGRLTAPTVAEQVKDVQADALETASGLRVIALHDEADAVANTTEDSGAQLVLDRTKSELSDEFTRAPWIQGSERVQLLHELEQLRASQDSTTTDFSTDAEALAAHIEQAFGSVD